MTTGAHLTLSLSHEIKAPVPFNTTLAEEPNKAQARPCPENAHAVTWLTPKPQMFPFHSQDSFLGRETTTAG